MVTSTPPHNLGEVIDAVKATILNHKITTEELMQYIQGPDFPTGGIVINKDDLLSVYETGTGKIRLRGRVEIEKLKGGKERIVITEIPYTMMGANIGKFLNDIAGLVENKTTTDIVDISNQSLERRYKDRSGAQEKCRYAEYHQYALQKDQTGGHVRCQYACRGKRKAGNAGIKSDHRTSH